MTGSTLLESELTKFDCARLATGDKNRNNAIETTETTGFIGNISLRCTPSSVEIMWPIGTRPDEFRPGHSFSIARAVVCRSHISDSANAMPTLKAANSRPGEQKGIACADAC